MRKFYAFRLYNVTFMVNVCVVACIWCIVTHFFHFLNMTLDEWAKCRAKCNEWAKCRVVLRHGQTHCYTDVDEFCLLRAMWSCVPFPLYCLWRLLTTRLSFYVFLLVRSSTKIIFFSWWKVSIFALTGSFPIFRLTGSAIILKILVYNFYNELAWFITISPKFVVTSKVLRKLQTDFDECIFENQVCDRFVNSNSYFNAECYTYCVGLL